MALLNSVLLIFKPYLTCKLCIPRVLFYWNSKDILATFLTIYLPDSFHQYLYKAYYSFDKFKPEEHKRKRSKLNETSPLNFLQVQ